MTLGSNKDVVTKFVDAMSVRGWEGFDPLCNEDVEWRVPGVKALIPVSGTHRGLPAIKAFLSEAVLEFGERLEVRPGDGLKVQRIIAEGDTVVVEHEVKAITKTGDEYHNYYCLSFDLVNGKISRIREYVDSLYAYDKGMFRKTPAPW